MDDAFFGDFTLAAAAPASAPPSPEAVAEESSLVLDGIERAASLTTTGLALHPRMAGKLGSGRHGCSAERKLLSIHMHRCKERAKFAKSIGKLEDFVAGMKSVCRLRKSRAGKLNLKTNKFTRKTIAKPMTGNRHNDVIDPSWYLACAFRDVKIPNVSKSTHRMMRTVVSMTIAVTQLRILASVAALLKNQNAAHTIVKRKWDEASKHLRLRLSRKLVDGTRSDATMRDGVWNIMVLKLTLLVTLQNNTRLLIKLAMAPTLIPGLTADHLHRQLNFHPLYATVVSALEYIKNRSDIHLQMDLAAYYSFSACLPTVYY